MSTKHRQITNDQSSTAGQRPAVTAILPFYNEQKTLLTVLRALLGAHHLSQIVLVNDGSRDGSVRLLRRYLNTHPDPRVKFIDSKLNHGKASAVGKGLDVAQHDLILLYDADMQYAKAELIDRMIEDFWSNNDQLLIAALTDKPLIFKNKLLDYTSGERMFYKAVLMPYRHLLNDRLGYGLEVLINHLHRKRGIRISYDYGDLGHIYKNKDHIKPVLRPWALLKEGIQVAGALLLLIFIDRWKK